MSSHCKLPAQPPAPRQVETIECEAVPMRTAPESRSTRRNDGSAPLLFLLLASLGVFKLGAILLFSSACLVWRSPRFLACGIGALVLACLWRSVCARRRVRP